MSTRHLTAPDLAKVAVFAALIAALTVPGSFTLFGSTVPVTLQTLGVMLAGSLLGPWLGALAVLVYLAVGALGMPVFAGGTAGIGVFAGPTAGYLVTFPLAAMVIGLIARALRQPGGLGAAILANLVGGVFVVYAIGVPVLAWRAGLDLDTAFTTGAIVFLPGDAIKVVLAALVAIGVHRAYPPLSAVPGPRRASSSSSS